KQTYKNENARSILPPQNPMALPQTTNDWVRAHTAFAYNLWPSYMSKDLANRHTVQTKADKQIMTQFLLAGNCEDLLDPEYCQEARKLQCD
ncbi:hypothetical protein FRC18_000580, partial [Serendipita sp. 400]